MNAPSNTPRNYWPHAIIAWFLLFGSALAVWVSVAVRQQMDLVRPDYYEEELRFQAQLDRMNRSAALRDPLFVTYEADRREVVLRLPAAHASARVSGNVQFYRPSDAALDFEVPLTVDATGSQRIDVRSRRDGQWKLRVRWKTAAESYFFEQTLVLIPAPVESAGALAERAHASH